MCGVGDVRHSFPIVSGGKPLMRTDIPLVTMGSRCSWLWLLGWQAQAYATPLRQCLRATPLEFCSGRNRFFRDGVGRYNSGPYRRANENPVEGILLRLFSRGGAAAKYHWEWHHVLNRSRLLVRMSQDSLRR